MGVQTEPVAAKLKEAAAALGAGVGALGNHEVYEAGPASGGNEDLATAGLRAGIRCRGGREGGGGGSGDGSRVLACPGFRLPVDVVDFPCLSWKQGKFRLPLLVLVLRSLLVLVPVSRLI
ncbi:hypothetical protein OPV22_030966 [Ensete ventricosum]|uniref:Uncharacterized protein n=1 Tax=Ensete ventricosum TaxID=4639 RepID=A0AAV8PTB1_ENSVE|nr:hypothetical protein OPV22_030966 [Ensete ventricosum]